MAKQSAKEFLGRLAQDASFRDAFAKAKEAGNHGSFLDDSGFRFDTAELEQAREELGLDADVEDDLGDVVGGAGGDQSAPGPICGC